MPAPMIIATPLAVICGSFKTRSKFSLLASVPLFADDFSISNS